MSPPSLAELLEFALAITREAGQLALGYFQGGAAVERKTDATPVTIADREAEQLLRQRIAGRFPDHGIIGEEFGEANPAAPCRWLLDPIDGTQTFIRGVPLWGVMAGLEFEGDPVAGVVHFPALQETLWARRGGGAWWNGQPARVSDVTRLEDATLLTTDVRGFSALGKQAELERLRARATFERTWGDCYGHALVATGRAEIMLDPILNEWDACALRPILEEAGGHFVTWEGHRDVRGGSGIATNAALHDEVLRVMRG